MAVRLHTVYLLPQVISLNGLPVESKEKVHAANMHSADAEALRLIRRKYFPTGELDDGGGAIPPASAGGGGRAPLSGPPWRSNTPRHLNVDPLRTENPGPPTW